MLMLITCGEHKGERGIGYRSSVVIRLNSPDLDCEINFMLPLVYGWSKEEVFVERMDAFKAIPAGLIETIENNEIDKKPTPAMVIDWP